MADLLSKLVEAVTSSAAGGERSARNIGVPGYPVPPEMRPEDPVDEAADDPLPKSIQHLDDLSPDEFIRFLDKYRKLPLEGGLEVSEKVDGSARMSFGVENGRLWTKSKNGPRRHASTEYPKSHVWDAIRMAHRALESHREKIVAAWPSGPREFVCEILFTHVPNSIEYGPNVIMVHGVVAQDTQVLPDRAAKRITNKFIGRVGNKLSDGKDTWLLEYKRVIPHDQLMVDVEEEFQSLDDVRKELKKIRTHGPKQAAMARFKDIQLAVKDKLLAQMRKQRPTYGKDGGDIEGLVFRDLESGQMVKLVDRDFFTSLNKFMWFYRELLGRGVKVGEKWVPGIGQRLKNYIAEEVMGSPVAKTSQFVSYLQRNYGKPGNPEELDTLIARYVQDEGLMRGDFLSRFRNVLEKTEVEFEVVKRDWESRKDGQIIFRSKDGREREMPDVVKARTQAAFDEMEETISGMQGMIDVLEKMPDELTQKVGLVKIMLGQNGLEKLEGGAKVKDTKKMHEDAGQPAPVFRGLRGLNAQDLKRLGGDPSRQEGQADLDGVDKKGYWSANPKIALVYATTAATAEREGPFMAILRGSYSGATKGTAQAINPGNPVDMEKIYWASNPARLKTFNLTEAGSVGPKKLSPEKATQMAQVVQDNADKLAQRKIDVSNAKPLGVGGNGVAFDLGQTVLKVTKDDKEANSSMVIKGKDFPNIVKVFDVFRFPETPYFGIWQEKLQPIPPQDKNEFTEFVTDIEVESGMFSDLWKLGDWKEIVDYAMEGAREDEEATPESIARIRKEIMVLQRKYQMDKIVAQLKAAKIQFRDFHGGNVMMRGSEHVLIDLGYSKSPKQQVANLESIVSVVSNLIEAGPPPIPASQRRVPKDAAGKALGIDMAGAKNFINKNLEKLAKKGINGNAAKQIGQGTRGVAFDIGNNRVLKISNDVQEAIAANKLKEFNLKHVVRFFDVFRFPEEDPKLGHVYGVVQEKLIPLGGADSSNQQVSGESAELNNALIKLQLPQTIYKSGYDWDRTKQMVAEFVQSEIKRKYPQFSSDDIDRKYAEKYAAEMNGYWKICTQKFHIGDMVQELSAKGVKFHDYHAGNIMKRPNGEYVLIDIGYSKVAGGKEPGVLERVMETIISELSISGPVDFNPEDRSDDVEKFGKVAEGGSKADTVGVTIGRFQPFHKGHAEIIRKLTTRFTKVVVIVAGNRPDAKNPFSYELRRELMEMSLPDVEPKLEVYKAEVDGKATGYLPGILNRIIVDKNSSVEYDTAITILVGPDRYDDVKRMVSTAKKGDGQYFDPGLAVVEKMPDVTNDDQAGRISGTQVRAALVANKKDQVGQLLDPHVLSDKTAFDDIYQRMRDEMSRFVQLRELREDASNSPNLDAVGGVVGMGEILAQNADVIQRARGIDVTNAKILGNGQMGVAFEVPGNRVLKLTTDHEEAKTAAYLKGKSKDHIAKFFDVFGLKATKDSGHPVYCVLEEKLVPLDENEQREFNDFAINYLRSNEVVNTTATKPFKDVWEKVREVVINDVMRDLGLSREIDVSKQPGHDMAPGVVKRVNRAQGLIVKTLEELKEIVQKYQIDKMVDELREMNIQFADFHGGNVMKRGQNYVINDLGKSKSPGVEPPQIEMIVREFVELLGERPVGGVGGGYGDAQVGVKAGSSGWSSSRNMTDKDEPEDMTWQEMIPDPNLKMRP
jgi:cytidyltransferase-like protein